MQPRPRLVGRSGPPRIVIADDAGLIYSDDWRNGWLSGFKSLGCDVRTINIAGLRQQVVRGPYSARGGKLPKALATNIVRMEPDLVWCHHGRAASSDLSFLAELRKHGIRTAVYLCDEPYEIGETARYSPHFDFVFTMDPCTIETHLQARELPRRRNVFYLPPCADTDLFVYRDYAGRSIPAFFLGNPTLIPREPYLRAVEKLVDGADIRYWPQSNAGRKVPVSKGHKLWIPAQDHPKWYANTVVGLNVHRHPGITRECFERRVKHRHPAMSIPMGMSLCDTMPTQEGTGFWNDANLPAGHVNPRFFEFAACGTLVVSDNHRFELDRMFPMAPQAESVEHYVELVLYYLNHRDEAEEIGRACSVQVSRRHSYRHRAAEVLIRAGLMDSVRDDVRSSLGVLEDFLSPQDWQPRGVRSLSAPTGRSERWSPAYGLSLMRTSGSPNRQDSLDAPTPWASW